MPELGILPSTGIIIPPSNIDQRASYFNQTPLPVITPSTAALSRANAKAALFGSIGDTLAKLPDTLMSAYQAGKKLATGSATTNAYNAALAGKPPAGVALTDFKATGDGGVTFQPENAELNRLKLDHYRRELAPAKPSFYEQEAKSAQPSGGSAPALPVSGSDAPVLPASDSTDSDNLDYLDGYGSANGAKPAVSGGVLPGTPTDADRSSALLPPGTHQVPPKPNFRGTIPLSQLSDFPTSGSQVAPQDAAAIQGAATNIGQQLTGLQPSDVGAATGTAATPVASIAPVSREQALATFAASQPSGVSASSDDSAQGSVSQSQTGSKTIDPATGVITLKTDDGRQFILTPGGHGYQEVKPQGGAPTVPAMIRTEAIRMGVYKDGMTAEQVAKAMEDKQVSEGVIPPHLLPVAQSMARLITQHPALKHYPTIREAKEAVDAGLKNPDTGGFSDMALVEGFQRMINPGATVRAQTINSMMDAAGFLQKLDPSFLWNKAVQGDKFSPEARTRIKKLADDIYGRATKNAEPQLKALGMIAKSYGISNPEQFVNNALVMSPLVDTTGADPAAPATGAAGSPAAPAAAATPKDTQAATWAKANPTDPRAAAIKAAQQAKGIWVD